MGSTAEEVRVKRIYAAVEPEDGVRVLVDRLWPRGLSKEKAAVDLWLRGASPSDELRKWYGHDPSKWDEFRARYFAELDAVPDELTPLASYAGQRLTLLYSSREERLNNAFALREYLGARAARPRRKA